ncbi:hypothetical protein L227DRAFT_420666 [Lentinus tigrinus ALCF2SS1-6]|uniref:F-box domain-containing protein n=1 Tax=Lentinus tigrinus ALCF2SS1-6 TaxID=1328759 RepID=A0A5C2RPQ7_9APHY|nr:hypothetical protein L227DRAFT_420666 [Lentinus tigrinus ALCF2SS1-6]
MKDFLSLNYDVLLAIFAHLHGADALNVALSSKRVYELAGPRIASHIVCTSPKELRRLHAYLLSNFRGTQRAKFLEKFIIQEYTFQRGNSRRHFSQVPLIGDILLQASNIRELYFEKFHPCMERDPRIVSAIRSLTRIVKLDLFVIADATLSIFDSSWPLDKLTHLNLSYYDEGDFPLDNQAKSLQPLISILPSFRRLRTLKVCFLDSTSRLPRAASLPSTPLLPSIGILHLREVSTSTLDLVDLCPNLSTLTISLSSQDVERMIVEGPKWPSLGRLMVGELDEVRWFSERLRTVDQLQIGGRIRLNPYTTEDGAMPPKQRLLELLRDTSPVGLYMCMELSGQVEQTSESLAGFWSDMARAAPRLWSFEIQLYRRHGVDWHDYSWVSKLLHALSRSVPILQCLRVLVPHETRYWYLPQDKKANVARDRQEEIDRVKALNALPPLLAHAFPWLRYLSVADAAPNMYLLQDTPLEPSISALQVDEGAVGWGWDELRHLMGIRRQRWWRVVYGPHGRELVEITSEEGEAAQQEIETSGSMTLTEDSMPYH